MEEEIDLREYIEILLKYWKWIMGAALLAAIAAFVVTSMLPRVYEAQSDILVLKSKTEISFEPKYQTEIAELSSQSGYQKTLVNLATSSDVASSVLEQAKDILSPEEQNIESLLKKVEITNTGDVISIKATDQNPQTAADLANLWTRAYTQYVNTLFGGESEALLAEIRQQAQDVSQIYEIAQNDWEQFSGDNQITFLQREIDAQKKQAQELRDSVSLEQKSVLQMLTGEYQQLNQIENWLQDAQAMRNQFSKPTSSASAQAGNALALIMLRSQILAGSTESTLQIQLNLADLGEQAISVEDVDSLINVLQTRQEALKQSIAERSVILTQNAANPGVNVENLVKVIADLDAKTLILEEQLEAQKAKQRELEQTRDLTWENLTTIQRKLAETELTSQITDTQIRIAASAVVPEKPVSSGRLMNTAIAGILGAMLAVFVVFAKEYWQSNDLPVKEMEKRND